MNVTGLYWLQVNIGSGNGLCRQAKAIKRVDIDQFYAAKWRHQATMC